MMVLSFIKHIIDILVQSKKDMQAVIGQAITKRPSNI